MVNYQCTVCKKEFTDKTKFTYHLNRTRPCIPFGSLLQQSIKKSTLSKEEKDSKTEQIERIESNFTRKFSASDLKESGKNTPHFSKKMPVLEKENKKNTENTKKIQMELEERIKEKNISITNKCMVCNKEYKDTFLEHLILVHEIEKEERTFSFSKKTSGLTIYENEPDCGDIVVMVFSDNKALVFPSSNMHNLQRHKKEKYEDIQEWIYYPCKDIKIFKDRWRNKLWKNKITIYDEKKKIEKNIILEWLSEVIEEINGEKERRVESEYKSSFYYKCPLCDFKHDKKEDMNIHLVKTHKSIRHTTNFVINDEHRDKIINILEKNNKGKQDKTTYNEENECIACHAKFSSRFNLNRHLKESCKNADALFSSRLLDQTVEIKDDLRKLIESNKKLKEENEKLREVLLGNQEIIKGSNETMKNSVNYINNTTNIIQNNNILFNINDFGQEDISHIQYPFVEGIIKDMNTDSLVKFIEEVHYGNPRNCNVMIPTNIPSIQENNMLLIKKGDRWIVDKRKNVIDGMLTVNMDRIVDVYEDMSDQLKESEKSNFEGYVNSMEEEDHERNHAIQRTEQLLLEHKPTNNLLLENCKIQQNNYIGNKLVGSVELTLPQQSSFIENEEKDKFLEMMNKPTIVDLEDSLKSFQLPR